MNKTYEQLRAKVYSIIYPDGIPLEEDVEFLWTNKDFTKTLYKVIDIYYTEDVLSNTTGFSMYAIDYSSKTMPKEIMSFDNPFDYEEPQTFYDFAKVLGKPLELQSYFLALIKTLEGKDVNVWNCWVSSYGRLSHNKEVGILDIDLTKTLKEQDEHILEHILEQLLETLA